MIQLFKNASKKGLEPEDYDAPRWDARLRSLQGSANQVARFDVTLTVCTMRYVSDLRIGRINPQHVNFGLNVENKKYNLAQFLRDRLLPAPDIPAALDGIEPSFAGYRSTVAAISAMVASASKSLLNLRLGCYAIILAGVLSVCSRECRTVVTMSP
jgi:murein L,D-transpeptidase YcbB/YkuD